MTWKPVSLPLAHKQRIQAAYTRLSELATTTEGLYSKRTNARIVQWLAILALPEAFGFNARHWIRGSICVAVAAVAYGVQRYLGTRYSNFLDEMQDLRNEMRDIGIYFVEGSEQIKAYSGKNFSWEYEFGPLDDRHYR